MTKIGIVIVLYNQSTIPDINNLKIEYELIIVDNTIDQDLKINDHNLHYIPLKENFGIAFAQNIGIQKARSLNCSHIIFLDQDSIPNRSFIDNIIQEYIRLKKRIPNLFALGPKTINGRTNEEYKPKYRKEYKDTDGFTIKSEIISSGTCVSIVDIDIVGLLNESLFIDYVDNEWLWRATKKGFVNGVTDKVSMTHFIGQDDIYILGYPLRISSPSRYYFQSRNYLWLCTLNYVPLRWKYSSFIKLFVLTLFLPFKHIDSKNIFKNIILGIKDGLIKRKLYKPIQDEKSNSIRSC